LAQYATHLARRTLEFCSAQFSRSNGWTREVRRTCTTCKTIKFARKLRSASWCAMHHAHVGWRGRSSPSIFTPMDRLMTPRTGPSDRTDALREDGAVQTNVGYYGCLSLRNAGILSYGGSTNAKRVQCCLQTTTNRRRSIKAYSMFHHR
jgi:hypothetical protein